MDSKKVSIVDIQVNYKEAVEAMARYQSSIAATKEYLKSLQKELKDGKITQDEYNKAFVASKLEMKSQSEAIGTLSKHINNQMRTQKEQNGSLKQLRAELSNATSAYDALSSAERNSAKGEELKKHINVITQEIKQAEGETSRFYRNVGNYPADTEKGLTTLKSRFQELGKVIAGAFAVSKIVGFGKSIVELGRGFDDAMAKVRAVTQATTEDYKMMREEALRMGEATAYTATEAAGALENLTRNGLTASQATEALSSTMQFAQANSISLAESADIMTNVSNGFNLGVGGMAQVSDALAYAASHSATNVSELAEALKNAAPFGAALGQPIEEINAALGTLADVGLKGSDAGTSLRMVMLGLGTTTAKQQKIFEKYGIEITQQSLKSDGLTKSLRKLKESGIMESANSASELADVFGRRVSPAAMSFLNNVDKMEQKLEGLKGAQGTTSDMFKVSMSNVTIALKSLESSWQSLLTAIYNSQSDSLVAPLEALRQCVLWIKDHLADVGNIIVGLIAGISFTKLVSSAQAAFTQVKTSAISNAETAKAAVEATENQIVILRRQVASLTKQVELTSGAERIRCEEQLFEKKRALAEQEKALVKAKTTEIKTQEQVAALSSGSAWTVGMRVATIAVKGFVTASKAAFKGFVLTAIITFAYEAIMKLVDAFSSSKMSMSGFMTVCTNFIKRVLNGIIGGVESVINWFVKWANSFKPLKIYINAIKLGFSVLWTTVKGVINGIVTNFKGMVNIVKKVGTLLKDLFTGNWGNLSKGFNEVMTAIGNHVKTMFNLGKDLGKKIADDTKNGVKNLDKEIKPVNIKYRFKEEETKKKTTVYKANDGKVFKTEKEAAQHNGQIQKAEKAAAQQTSAKTGEKSPTKTSGSTASTGGKSRSESAQEKAKEQELKLVEQANQAIANLYGDSIAARKVQLQQQYDSEIDQLKTKLGTDKTLTERSKDAINQLLYAKGVQFQEEMAKLDESELKATIDQRTKINEARLAASTKGSKEELDLKLQTIEDKKAADLLALESEEEAALRSAQISTEMQENKLSAMRDQGGYETEEMQRQTEAVAASHAYQLELQQGYEDMRMGIITQALKDEEEAQAAHDDFMQSQRQLVLQKQIDELQMNEDQKYELRQNMDTLNLDVVTEGEMRILEIKKQMADDNLSYVMEKGRQEGETVEQFEARKTAAQQQQVQADVAQKNAQKKNDKAFLNSKRQVTDSLVNLVNVIGESNKGFAIMSKMITLAQIAIDTGKAISAGIASASELPFPSNLAAIATTIATILTNVTTAISTVKSAKFAKGGKVRGAGTGTSDSIPASLSNGEFVMTAKATSLFEPLLTAMNAIGGGVPMQVARSYEQVSAVELMSQKIEEAMGNIQPVVSVEEINDIQSRVRVIQNLDNI